MVVGEREGDQLKAAKWDIQDFMILELKGIKQIFKVLNIYFAYWGSAKCLFLVLYNSKTI